MILVTGGTGLLGSHLLFQLTSQGEPIRAIYRDKARINAVEKLFSFYDPENFKQRFETIEWVKGDVMDVYGLEVIFDTISIVYHCAGLVSFNKRDFNLLMKTNREGTANIVNVCLSKGIKKLCYVSSTAAIGGENNTLIDELTKWKQSPEDSAYSISKYSAEKEVWRGVEEGLDCVIVNPSVIFGAGNWNETSMTMFRTMHKGLKFYTSGKNGFVDARDVAEIMVRLTNSQLRNERYLCVGHSEFFKDLFVKIAQKMGKTPPSINTPRWLVGTTWRLSVLIARISGKNPAITRESARSAFNVKEYDNRKVKELLNFEFRTLEDTIENAILGRIK